MPLGCVTKGTLEEPVSRSKWGLTPNGRLQKTLHTAGTWRQYLLLSLTQRSPSPSGTKPLEPQLPLGPDGFPGRSQSEEHTHPAWWNGHGVCSGTGVAPNPTFQTARRARASPSPLRASVSSPGKWGEWWLAGSMCQKQSLKHCTHRPHSCQAAQHPYRLTATRAQSQALQGTHKATLHDPAGDKDTQGKEQTAASEPQGRVRAQALGVLTPVCWALGEARAPSTSPAEPGRQGHPGDQCEPRPPLLALAAVPSRK